MKKNLFIVLCISILFSCNQSSDKSESHSNDSHSMSADTTLTLNNGAKWTADSITNHNVIRLRVTANMFRVEPFPSLSNYQVLGNDLGSDVDTLLQQCKMKGADHDALHKWLEPILSQSNQLKNITDTTAARKIFSSVDGRINSYDQYFQ